jgi:ADP-heptose:LPS heptosyltransferase
VSNNRAHCLLEMERYAQAVNRLASQHRLRVVVSSLMHEAAAGERLVRMLQPPAKAIPTETLDAMLMLTQASRCLFIGEGGVMHLAGALNKPQFVLIAQSSTLEWGPLNAKARYLSHSLHVNAIHQETIERELQLAWEAS